jgi:hypothetical protein
MQSWRTVNRKRGKPNNWAKTVNSKTAHLETAWDNSPELSRSGKALVVLDIYGLLACPIKKKEESTNSTKSLQESRLINIYRSLIKEMSSEYCNLFSRRGLLSLGAILEGETITKPFERKGDVEKERKCMKSGHRPYKLRPHSLSFLRWLESLPDVDVAILSSTTEPNASPLIERLIEETGISFVFIGYREMTAPDPEYKRFAKMEEKPIESYDTVKSVSDLLDRIGDESYSVGSTLILDDSPIKVRNNPVSSVVLVPTVTSSNLHAKSGTAEYVEANCFPLIAKEIMRRLSGES